MQKDSRKPSQQTDTTQECTMTEPTEGSSTNKRAYSSDEDKANERKRYRKNNAVLFSDCD